MNGVSQDSGELKRIASEIEDAGDKFLREKNELYDEIKSRLTEEESGSSAWWGPLAGNFKEKVLAKEGDFDKAYKNITSMAHNLEEQANAWESFENA